MNIDYPLHFDGNGRTAATDEADHVRDLIEQVLFTQPGERVNRPDLGSGVLQLVFAPLGQEVAATVEMLVKESLQRWLGDRITVASVASRAEDSALHIRIDYMINRTGQRISAEFVRGSAGS